MADEAHSDEIIDADPIAVESQKKSAPNPGIGRSKFGRYEIDFSRPISAHDHQYADAFECSSQDTGQNDHIAVLVKGRFPARQSVIDSCMVHHFEGVMDLRASFPIDYETEQCQRLALIFKRPPGIPLFQKYIQKRDPIPEDVLRRFIIRPVFYALRLLTDHSVFHGNIRPDNIFMTTHEGAEAVLGECISSIPGSIQPTLYETIERGMALPEGRGVGTSKDDIYALGATIAVLIRGFNPLHGKSNRFIVEEKINRSSYSVLTDGLRLPPGLSEFLRATLNDDATQRWNMDQLAAWVEGSRTTPKQSSLWQKAQRALDFNGKKYIRPRMLAKDLFDNVPEAIQLIETGHLLKWIERALSNTEMLNNVNGAISRASAGGRVSGYEDRMLCMVSMALDPLAPIRYKGISVYPQGLGYALSYAAINDKSAQDYGDIIRDRYAWMWLNYKENAEGFHPDIVNKFDQASKLIVRRGIDYGIERCIYELCSDTPCLSPYFKNHYVYNIPSLLTAINDIADRNKDKKPMDRHVASFISVRDTKDNSGLLSILEENDKIKRSLALVTLYQIMQKRFDNPKLEDLCSWLQPDIELVINRFHNENVKKTLMKQIPREIQTGNLTRIMMLIDNPLNVKKDQNDFALAKRQYISYDMELDRIRNSMDSNREFGYRSGRQTALFIAMVLSGVMLACTFIMNLPHLVK